MAASDLETRPSVALRQRAGTAWLAGIGRWLLTHQRTIQNTQWVVVAAYVALLVVPAVLPLPDRHAHLWSNITLAAQFLFWGVWWPFVLLSMILVGRAWCGLLCPEGALSEAASRHGRGQVTPRWMRWPGWPFVAFASTTIYGQLVSVYQYPKPAVVILGGSTLGAIVVGFLYGRNKRVWCRYLCPVNGVFGVLSKLAPLHFAVDESAWNAWHKPRGSRSEGFNCAPLVVMPTKQSNSTCHMCGRCEGFRGGAVALQRRSPNDEIVRVAGYRPEPWETVLIIFGMIGLAAGAFHWSSSTWLVEAKQMLAERLIAMGLEWPLEPVLPWWLLTNYPDQNDSLSPLDGVLLVGYIVASSVVIGGLIAAALAVAVGSLGRFQPARFHHLAQALIPVAGCGVFLGLSALTVTMLKTEGVYVGFVSPLRMALLAGAGAWSMSLGVQILCRYSSSWTRIAAAAVPLAIAIAIGCLSWATLFWSFGSGRV